MVYPVSKFQVLVIKKMNSFCIFAKLRQNLNSNAYKNPVKNYLSF